jgi:Domain of unknown function (DUF4328)
LLAGQVVLAAAQFVVMIHQISVLNRVQAGLFVSESELHTADSAVSAASNIEGLLFIATVVAWCIWQHRSQRNAIELTGGGLRFTPGWAVGWWFIPIANLFMPFQTVRELWGASHGGDAWRRLAKWSVIGWWWALFVLSNVHIWLGTGDGGVELGTGNVIKPTSNAGLISRDKWMLLSLVLQTVAAFLAVLIVLAVGRLQATASAARIPAMPGLAQSVPDLPAPPPA